MQSRQRYNKNQNTTASEIAGQGFKITITSNKNDNWTRIEVLLGFKLSGLTDTLTDASNMINDLYKKCEIQNEQQ